MTDDGDDGKLHLTAWHGYGYIHGYGERGYGGIIGMAGCLNRLCLYSWDFGLCLLFSGLLGHSILFYSHFVMIQDLRTCTF